MNYIKNQGKHLLVAFAIGSVLGFLHWLIERVDSDYLKTLPKSESVNVYNSKEE